MPNSSPRTGSRLGLGYWTLVLAMLIVVAFGGYRVALIFDSDRQIEEKVERHEMALEWKRNTRMNLTRTLAIARSGNLPSLADLLKPQMTDTSAQIAERQKYLERNVTNDAGKALIAAVGERRKAYIAIRDAVFGQMQGGDVTGAKARIESGMIPAARTYLDAIEAVEQNLLAESNQDNALKEENLRAKRVWYFLIAAAVLAVAVQTVLSLRR